MTRFRFAFEKIKLCRERIKINTVKPRTTR